MRHPAPFPPTALPVLPPQTSADYAPPRPLAIDTPASIFGALLPNAGGNPPESRGPSPPKSERPPSRSGVVSGGMDVRVTSDPKAFDQLVFPFLQRDPVLHTIIMSNVHERAAGSYRTEDEPSYFVSVHDGEVVGVAMRTAGRNVYLGALRPDLAEPVADAYLDVLPELSGVAGDRAAASRFAERWCARRGGTAKETRATRLHKL